jgi:uncharacterized protein (TIGR03435 family)
MGGIGVLLLWAFVLIAPGARAQGAPPPPPGRAPGETGNRPVAPTAQMKITMAAISAYADAQCTGKEGDAADACRLNALWDAANCVVAAKRSDAPQGDTPSADAAAQKSADVPIDAECARAAGPSQFEYEVASIKPDTSGRREWSGMITAPPDGLRIVNTGLGNLVNNAYYTGLQLQISGLPGWANEDRYDVEAKMAPEVADALTKLSDDDRALARSQMMRLLLRDRLNFKAHVDMKEVPAYDLVIGKNGPKLTPADPNSEENGNMRIQPDPDHPGMVLVTAKGMTVERFAQAVQGVAGRPVFDKTGLTGIYDITMRYARQNVVVNGAGPAVASEGGDVPSAPDPSGGGASVLTDALNDLGLKLVPSRGPKAFLTIERMDKPDAN